MLELTMILFLACIGVFTVSFFVKKNEMHWLSMFVAVCSIAQSITDQTLEETEMVIVTVLCLFVMLISGINAFFKRL